MHDSSVYIFYDYFSPAYKAGGPTQSLVNLVQRLEKDLDLQVVCRDRDHDGTVLDVVRDVWVKRGNSRIFYAATAPSKAWLRNLSFSDVLYVNGLYSPRFNLFPLLFVPARRKIVAVRGMLHPGALSQKALKKKLYLSIWKLLGLANKVEFHATAPEEAAFIRTYFGENIKVWTIPNFPKNLSYLEPMPKQPGVVNLVSIALISPMKNHLLILQALASVKAQVHYHIFGPVKDAAYWELCQREIAKLPAQVRVTYHGDVNPDKIADALSQAHVFILPSKSENFGHSIFEAFSSGKPVITSEHTPWNGLQDLRAGLNVAIEHPASIVEAVESFAAMEHAEYEQWTLGARKLAEEAIDVASLRKAYLEMFTQSNN